MKNQIESGLDFDFAVDPRPLSKSEEKAISDFILKDKEKRKIKNRRKKTVDKSKTKQPA